MTRLPKAPGEVVSFVEASLEPSKGSAELPTQVAGAAATVSQAAEATGGIKAGNMIETA